MSDLITVPFHGANLYLVEHQGQPYVPMKPVVEGIGLDWGGQHKRMSSNADRWGVVLMEIPSASGSQITTCLPLRKLAGWMATVQASRIKSERVREKVVEYQNECDDTLWRYWNEGHAVNPRAQQPARNEAAVEFGKMALAHLPNLGENSKQALLSHISELAFGQRLIPLPQVEHHLMPAGEVGEKLGITGTMVGRIANANGIKVPQYGEFRLDKSKHSSKQVESFVYNEAGLERLRELLAEKRAA